MGGEEGADEGAEGRSEIGKRGRGKRMREKLSLPSLLTSHFSLILSDAPFSFFECEWLLEVHVRV